MTRNLPRPGMARWLSGLPASALLVAAMSGLLVLLKIPDLQDSIATFRCKLPCIAPGFGERGNDGSAPAQEAAAEQRGAERGPGVAVVSGVMSLLAGGLVEQAAAGADGASGVGGGRGRDEGQRVGCRTEDCTAKRKRQGAGAAGEA